MYRRGGGGPKSSPYLGNWTRKLLRFSRGISSSRSIPAVVVMVVIIIVVVVAVYANIGLNCRDDDDEGAF